MSSIESTDNISCKLSEYEENMGALYAPYIIAEMLMVAKNNLYDLSKFHSLETIEERHLPLITCTNKDSLRDIIESYLQSINVDYTISYTDSFHSAPHEDSENKIHLRALYCFKLKSLADVKYAEDKALNVYSFANYPAILRKLKSNIPRFEHSTWGRIPIHSENHDLKPIKNSIYSTSIPSRFSSLESESTIAAKHVLELIALSVDEDYENFLQKEYADLTVGKEPTIDTYEPEDLKTNNFRRFGFIMLLIAILLLYAAILLNIN